MPGLEKLEGVEYGGLSRTHEGGLPAPAVQSPSVIAQAGEASKGEGATRW